MATAAADTAQRVPMGALLARLGQEANARLRRSLRPLDLRAQEFIVLKQLELLGQCSQSELADAVGVDYSNLATLAAALCERGVIVRSRDDTDRRRYVLALTASGRRLVGRADEAVAAGERELLEALGDGEREQLHSLLQRVADGAELCPTASACLE
jgi:MarR family transcriptional regulator, lower aerobic nicotinate degradation pathway regulator